MSTIQTNAIKINQDLTWWNNRDRVYYIWKLKFSELKTLVELEFREYEENWEAIGIQRYYSDIRRFSDISKLKTIKDFLSDTSLDVPYFTSPIIFWFQSREGRDYFDIKNNQIVFSWEQLVGSLIVDWQHRYFWMWEKWKEDSSFDMELSVVFLIDYDKYQLSKVFANINFTQKPVNKSLYYDLFWSIPWDFNDLNFVHNLVHDLNFDSWSNLNWNIKMLWSWWEKAFISQAFLVEKLHKYFLNNSVLSENTQGLLIYYSEKSDEIKNKYASGDIEKEVKESLLWKLTKDFKSEPIYRQYYQFLDYYFEFINSRFWSEPKTRTTIWYWAFMRLIKDFFENNHYFIDRYKEILTDIPASVIDKINSAISNISGSSESSQSDLYKQISAIIFYEQNIRARKIILNSLIRDFRYQQEIKFIEIYSSTLVDIKELFPNNDNLPSKIKKILQLLKEEGYIEYNDWKIRLIEK